MDCRDRDSRGTGKALGHALSVSTSDQRGNRKRIFFKHSILATVLLLAGCIAEKNRMSRDIPLQLQFTLTEHFGVSHPGQIVTFDLPPHTPTSGVWVVNEASNAVPFQFVDGGRKLAVRTDLPAHAVRSWTLTAAPRGNPSWKPDATFVTLSETETYYDWSTV